MSTYQSITLQQDKTVSPIKVIVAEDHVVLRQDFSEMIENSSRMSLIGSASSGAEAVELALRSDVDIILMDIEMDSNQDGIDAAHFLSQTKPGVGIIFLTVHEDDETIYKAFSISNARNYLVKSASHFEILRCIEDAYRVQVYGTSSKASKLQSEFSRLKQTESNLMSFMSILSQLTQAERDIIKLLLDDYKVEEIARLRMVEKVTIKSQINTLLKKFGKKRTREITSLIQKLNLAFLFQIH